MTHFKRKPLLSLLLAMVMVVTMLPMTALAAEETDIPAAEVCTDEHCTHEHEPAAPTDVYTVQPDVETSGLAEDITMTASDEETPAEEASAPVSPEESATPSEPETLVIPADTEPKYSGYVGNSAVEWELDPASGRLFITGEGGCEIFTSRDDQPWATVRTEIREVWFNSMDTLTIENLAYWFDGCTALETAEVPYTTPVIGTRAFAECPSLFRLMLYYSSSDYSIVPSAFYANTLTTLEIDYIASLDEPATVLNGYDWSADNRAAFFSDVYGMMVLATGYCSSCKGTYSYTLDYEQWTDSVHCIRHWCSNCGYDQCGGVNAGNHSYNNSGYCTYCGYYNSAYDYSSVCYHTSTRTTWSGCDWYEYCRSCGELVDSGTSHGTYVYDDWEYYNSSRHRRYHYCSDCGEGSYSYGYHSTTTSYGQYSSTQHSVQSYCSTCGSYVGSASYASHSFSYGSWQSYNGTQHRRLKTCSQCGYSEYEYANHSLSYGSWTNYSASQHRRSVSCSTCGYSSYEYAGHSLTNGAWASISDTQHRRTLSCSCGYSTTETANHSLTYGVWSSISDTQHQRTGSCSCGYSANDTGTHADADDDGYCDACEYLMTRFSVTVPASLSLTVSEHGEVYAANNAAIINNSTGAVEVTGVTLTAANGWTLVPYNYNMAAAQVNSKLIGFALNGAATGMSGLSENLSLPGGWTIAKAAALPLSYDAVVSATSSAILSEQVLSIVFIIEWAGV